MPDYHLPVHKETLEWLQLLVKDVDIDRYLPKSMMVLCENICRENGYTLQEMAKFKLTQKYPHKRVYLLLRHALQRVFTEDANALEELESPVGAQNWIEKHMLLTEGVEILDLYTGTNFEDLEVDLEREDPLGDINPNLYSEDDDEEEPEEGEEFFIYEDYEDL